MYNIKEKLNPVEKKYWDKDFMLCTGLLTLSSHLNGSRAIMYSSHLNQLENLINGELARVFTGWENEFGKNCNNFIQADEDMRVIAKIPKYSDNENLKYILLVYREESKMFDVIEKCQYESLTEKYAYKYDTDFIDNLSMGDLIEKDDVMIKPKSFDEFNNKGLGTNLLCVYVIDEKTQEDAIKVAESAKDKLKSSHVDTLEISANDNDIPCNLYGDQTTYKAIPDIGEDIKDGIFAAFRRKDKATQMHDLSYNKLSQIDIDTDTVYTLEGKIIDYDIYCNKPIDELPDKAYYKQIKKYLKINLDYSKRISETLEKYMDRNVSNKLAKMYHRNKNGINDDINWNKKGEFSNIVIKATVLEESGIVVGSKLTGRYGDKGTISDIVPDEEMIQLEDGRYVEVECNMLGIINRLNPGQLFEVELNFIADRITEKIKLTKDLNKKFEIVIDFISMVSKHQTNDIINWFKHCSFEDKTKFFEMLEEEGMLLHTRPFWECISLEQIKAIYDKFDWIEPYTCYIKSKALGRRVKIMNKLVVGDKYILKLKHHPASKFMAVNSGYINPTGVPGKSMRSKTHTSPYSINPTRWGEMEQQNQAICGYVEEIVRQQLMTRNSIVARRELTRYTYNCNITENIYFKLPEYAKNRNVEIFNVLLKSTGLRIKSRFDKDDLNEHMERYHKRKRKENGHLINKRLSDHLEIYGMEDEKGFVLQDKSKQTDDQKGFTLEVVNL